MVQYVQFRKESLFGYYFFDLIYQTIIAKGTKENGDKTGVYDVETIMNALSEYDRLWAEWENLYETADGCPSLFMKADKNYDFLGYASGGGFDAAIKNVRPTLTINGNKEIEVGETITAKATCTFGDKLVYTSSDPLVASVDEDGTVTGLSEGYTKITAATEGKTPLSAVFMVHVIPNDNIEEPDQPTDPIVEVKFEQTFDGKEDVDQWTLTGNNGSKSWNETDQNMILKGEADDGKGDVILTLPEPLTGEHLTYSADVLVKKQENDSLTLLGSNGKIITQLDFGGSNVGNKLTLNGHDGSRDVLPLVPYEADTLYHVEIGVNTVTKRFTVAVTDVKTGQSLLDGKTSYGFREAAEDLGQLKMGSRDGAVKPPILDGEMYIDNIGITQTTLPEEIENEYKTVFREDFSTDVCDQWPGGGEKRWEPGSMTLCNTAGKEATFTLPEELSGHLLITWNMKVNNLTDRAFFQPTMKDGKHITQVEFRGNANPSSGNIIVDTGAGSFPAITPYEADTFYKAAIDLDTRTGKIAVSVDDGKPVTINGYKQNPGDSPALAKLNIGIRDGAALTISDIRIMQEKEIVIPLEEIISRTDIKETTLNGSKLSFPAVPEGYKIQITETEPQGIFDANGNLIQRPAEDTNVTIQCSLADMLHSETAPVPMGEVSVLVTHGRQLINTKAVNLNEAEVTLGQGEAYRLNAEIVPANSDHKAVVWDSSDWNVATVSQDGLVVGISGGDAVITVASSQDKNLKASCTVHVEPGIPVGGIELSETELKLMASETVDLTATVTPSNATNPGVNWRSSDRNVARVDQNGHVTAVNTGTATITATTKNGGFKAECQVTVMKEAYRLTVEHGTIVTVNDKPCEDGASMMVPADSKVVIRAEEPAEGCKFIGWDVIPSDVVLDDVSALETGFVMPESPVKLQARYLDETASASNATVITKSSPSDWYAVADQDSLDALLDDDEIITEKDREYLEEGKDVQVILNLDKKEASYSNDAAEEIKDLLGENEEIAFFVKTSLHKKVEGISEEALATPSNAVRLSVDTSDEFNGMEEYRLIGWDSENGASDWNFEWNADENILSFDGQVNGLYAFTYAETGDIPEEDVYYTKKIKVEEKPEKLIYQIGDTFDPSGMVVIAEQKAIPSNEEQEITLSNEEDLHFEYDFSSAGKQDVKVIYYGLDKDLQEKEFTAKVPVTVLETEEDGLYTKHITVQTLPDKTEYYVGEAFDSSGMVVLATVVNSITEEETEEIVDLEKCTITPSVFTKAGSQKVTVSYTAIGANGKEKDFRDSFKVVVRSSASDDDGDDYRNMNSGSTVIEGIPAVFGTWTQTADGIWHFRSAGREYKNEWAYVVNSYADPTKGQLTADWFRFDENGSMVTGWYLDADGNWYYLSDTSDGTRGHMVTGWTMIKNAAGQEQWYYLNPVSDGTRGKLFVNTTTPDGYHVDENGCWIR